MSISCACFFPVVLLWFVLLAAEVFPWTPPFGELGWECGLDKINEPDGRRPVLTPVGGFGRPGVAAPLTGGREGVPALRAVLLALPIVTLDRRVLADGKKP